MQGPPPTTVVDLDITPVPAEHPPVSAGGAGSTVQHDMLKLGSALSTTVQQAVMCRIELQGSPP
jgi:hypothetical protein